MRQRDRNKRRRVERQEQAAARQEVHDRRSDYAKWTRAVARGGAHEIARLAERIGKDGAIAAEVLA